MVELRTSFYYRKKKKTNRINFNPIQLNLLPREGRKKGEKCCPTQNNKIRTTKRNDNVHSLPNVYILTICVQNPRIYAL